jgi:hypothetical protein
MAYIGPEPAESFTSFATQEFSTSATTSYTLDHAVANENEIALFVNNVRQQPGSGKAYTATGTALTLSAATASTDTMYCVFLGRALQTVTPATNSITAAMITDSTITSAKMFSGFANGITVADQFRLTTDLTADADPISSNLERIDTSPQGTLGSGMSVSSGIFTFPSTGIYFVSFDGEFNTTASGGDSIRVDLKSTTDNFSSVDIALATTRVGMGDNRSFFGRCQSLIDVTDVSNVKVKFKASTIDSGSRIEGDTAENLTVFTFIRLGDT